MRIEPKAAFYNEETGAVQPWKDIEVADAVGSELVAEGLAVEIGGGGGVMDEIFPLSVNMTLKMSGQGGGTSYQFTDLSQSGTWFAMYIPDDQYYQIYDGIVEFTDGDVDLVVFSSAPADDGGGYFSYDSTAWVVTVSGDAEIVDIEDDLINKYVHVFGDCTVTATKQ